MINLPKMKCSKYELNNLNSFFYENSFFRTNDILYRQYTVIGNKIRYLLMKSAVELKFLESSLGASYSKSGGFS